MGEDRKMGTHLCGIYLEQMRGLDRHEMGSTSLRACLLLQLDLGLHSWLWSAWDDTPLIVHEIGNTWLLRINLQSGC